MSKKTTNQPTNQKKRVAIMHTKRIRSSPYAESVFMYIDSFTTRVDLFMEIPTGS